jgi:CheY-like chemotaxis protein
MAEEPEFVALMDDEGSPSVTAAAPPWKVAVVDDDVAVHTGTRFALEGFSLNGRRLELHFAESSAQARAILERHADMAVILLDVVMETENAGLELVEYVRKELRNRSVRIILRTGQPGQAPERRVVVDYDINDYKAKTELTADKLFTAMTSALRSYEQLVTLIRIGAVAVRPGRRHSPAYRSAPRGGGVEPARDARSGRTAVGPRGDGAV